MAAVLVCAGTPYRIGRVHGEGARVAVRQNVVSFWQALTAAGYRKGTILGLAREQDEERSEGRRALEPRAREEIAGIADGAGLPYEEVLAYNLYRDLVWPEECTVMMAVGSASATGDTVFAKNSDKVGGESLVGPNFYKFKEINVILYAEREDGLKIVGVCAAGSTGLKMGMNNRGLAAGCNIARTEEMYQKKLDLTQIRAIDRAYLLRLGLEQENVLEATRVVAGRIVESPMATPGNLEFADARQAYIIEGSYDRVAVKKVTDDVDSRSNCFVVLKELNKKDDLSSICRYIRTQELLQAKKGRVTLEDLVEFSMDHAHGPGPNSICRHGTDFTEEVSLSAMVMELNGKEPQKSRFGICLGKPCHAWRDPAGHVFGDLAMRREDIPAGFFDGEVFKRFYQEDPRLA